MEYFFFLYQFKKECTKYEHQAAHAVCNVSGYRCVSGCKSRGREFDRGPVPYFRKGGHEMISTVIFLPSADSFNKFFFSTCNKRKYVHELMVNRLFKPAQEKVWLHVCELTVPP